MGASRCVPVCSHVSKAFQYHAGPRSSYRDSSQILNGGVLFHCGGSGKRGVLALSGWVRSTIRKLPDSNSATSCRSAEDILVGALLTDAKQVCFAAQIKTSIH